MEHAAVWRTRAEGGCSELNRRRLPSDRPTGALDETEHAARERQLASHQAVSLSFSGSAGPVST